MIRFILTIWLVFFIQNSYSQFLKDKKNVTKFEGYFTFYYDNSEDKIYLEVDELNSEFLYVHALSEGIGSNDIGIDRGQLGEGVILKFQKAGNKLLLIQPNQTYRAITDNEEEKKSIEEAFAKSVLHGFEIKEENNGVYLIDVTDFLIRDAHGVATRLEQNQQGNYSLDNSKSAINIDRTKAFLKNVEFDVILTFKGNPKGYNIKSVSPNASFVTVHQHHSFVELPDNNYKPRVFDPRCGSWSTSYSDYATPINQSLKKHFITRHRLEKKNPSDIISEAKDPIIYYLDRGVPEPIRSALLEGAGWWNQAFESAGYSNAFQVKLLPEGADPLDLRYNMIQWVHRSTRGWSYGGSITDPRTGEILKGHVSLGSLRIRQDFLIAQAMQSPYENNDIDDSFAIEMALARIRQLAAHEVGHTLGFAHNFAASTNNRSSVMDYPSPLLTVFNNKIDFSNAYSVGIGEWDKVIVAYSYKEFSENENSSLQHILNTAFAKGLRYISDEDARPLGSAHAYAHLWDNGDDPIKELDNVLKVREFSIQNFSKNNIKSNEPYSLLEDVFVPLYFYHRYQTEAVSKMIGGLDYSYAIKNDKQQIVKQLDPNIQREALMTLLKTIDIETIAIPKTILTLFPPRAAGYARTRESFKSELGVAFDPFGAVATASEMTLNYLFHPERATRLVQFKSINSKQLGFNEVVDIVIQHTFDKNYKDSYYQELQNIINKEFLDQLFFLSINENTYFQINAISNAKLEEIAILLKNKKSTGVQKMYEIELLKSIESFKKNPLNFKITKAPKIPDGSPIGIH